MLLIWFALDELELVSDLPLEFSTAMFQFPYCEFHLPDSTTPGWTGMRVTKE